MGFFELFRKKAKEETPAEAKPVSEPKEVEIYSGMRVEATAFDGRVLFAAKMVGLRGDKAGLYQYTESTIPSETEPIPVRIRGYNDHKRKAVYMEGIITPKPKHVWQVDQLEVVRSGNDRAFFRLSTDIDASITTFGGFSAGEKACKLVNISVGGACISTDHVFRDHDKFLLKVKLLEDRDLSVMYCEVLRITEKESGFEYGCQFLELTEVDQDRISQNIFAAQLKERNGAQ